MVTATNDSGGRRSKPTTPEIRTPESAPRTSSFPFRLFGYMRNRISNLTAQPMMIVSVHLDAAKRHILGQPSDDDSDQIGPKTAPLQQDCSLRDRFSPNPRNRSADRQVSPRDHSQEKCG